MTANWIVVAGIGVWWMVVIGLIFFNDKPFIELLTEWTMQQEEF